MRYKLFFILLLIPLCLKGQAEEPVLHEVVISTELSYGSTSLFIKADGESGFQYSILDMDKNTVYLTGKVTSLEPLVRTGAYSFNTPEGDPYVTGYYSNNIPFRGWKYLDADGQLINNLNYSAAIQFLHNYGDIDIGEDYVFEAKKAPKFPKKGMSGFLKFIRDNAVYPLFPLINQEQGTVTCQFVIDTNGQLINARIVDGVNEDFDLEVLRILSLSPKWTPGKMKGGEPAQVMYKLAVHFQLPD